MRKLLIGILSAVVALGVAALPALAASDDEVRSAFLYNLAKYVEWPAESFSGAETPFVIGVVEDTDFAKDLSEFVSGRTVDDRAFEVREVATVDEARSCHLLFATRSKRKLARELALELSGEPVLSVAENDRFINVGGMVGIEMKNGKISFEVSRSAAARGGLTVSSKLLRLASSVR